MGGGVAASFRRGARKKDHSSEGLWDGSGVLISEPEAPNLNPKP